MAVKSSGESINLNQSFLDFYLELMKGGTETFKSKDYDVYMLHAYRVRSMIPDPTFQEKIDEEIIKLEKTAFYKEQDEATQKFLQCFCIMNNCMSFLDTVFKITKINVEINADQDDEEMPTDEQ
jgi:hypothetical protein